MKFFKNPFKGSKVESSNLIPMQGFEYQVPSDIVGKLLILKQGIAIGGWTVEDNKHFDTLIDDIMREYEKAGEELPEDYERKLRTYVASMA